MTIGVVVSILYILSLSSVDKQYVISITICIRRFQYDPSYDKPVLNLNSLANVLHAFVNGLPIGELYAFKPVFRFTIGEYNQMCDLIL